MWIAIASGHADTLVLVYASKERIVSAFILPQSLNPHCYPEKKVIAFLRSILIKIRQDIRIEEFDAGDRLVLSLPGVSTPHDKARARRCIIAAGWPDDRRIPCFPVDDTCAGLVAGLQAAEGICAFAGSGASVFVAEGGGFVLGKPFKLDGWGPIIGDFGGGFRLAMSTLEHLCVALDEKTELPVLFERILQAEKGLRPPVGMQIWFNSLLKRKGDAWRLHISQLATIITKAADEGDDFAKQRVRDAAAGMANTLHTALKVFPRMIGKPITCQGGMFRNCNFYFDEVKARIEKTYGNPVDRAQFHPAVGALLMAASDDWTVPQGQEVRHILSAVRDLNGDQRARFVFFDKPAPRS